MVESSRARLGEPVDFSYTAMSARLNRFGFLELAVRSGLCDSIDDIIKAAERMQDFVAGKKATDAAQTQAFEVADLVASACKHADPPLPPPLPPLPSAERRGP